MRESGDLSAPPEAGSGLSGTQSRWLVYAAGCFEHPATKGFL